MSQTLQASLKHICVTENIKMMSDFIKTYAQCTVSFQWIKLNTVMSNLKTYQVKVM